jgi:imidazolonepropionase
MLNIYLRAAEMTAKKKPFADAVIHNIGILVNPVVSRSSTCDVHAINNAAIAFKNGVVCWAGAERELHGFVDSGRDTKSFDAGGATAVPGFVECHTHSVFAGSRADDFQRRTRGESYASIARAGGGIMTTVKATRAATEDALYAMAEERLSDFMTRGVTTVEIKSGYGLDLENELKILGVIKRLRTSLPCGIAATFLGAHAVPGEYEPDRGGYVRLIIDEMIPEIARTKSAEFCDVFCDEIAFGVEESRAILRAAAAKGLQPKVHADQLSRSGGAELAAELGAVSAEHLDHVSDEGIGMLARSGTVAVLLPTASIFSGSRPFAPGRKLIDAGVRVALSTDFNPGSSNTRDLALAGTVACTQMDLTVEEAFCGITLNAAAALAMEGEIGSVEHGKRGDVLLLKSGDWRDLFYCMGENLVKAVFIKGKRVVP